MIYTRGVINLGTDVFDALNAAHKSSPHTNIYIYYAHIVENH